MGSCVKNQLLSKIAMSDGHGENSPYFDGWKAYDNDPFHPVDNPEGVIQMGLSENQLCFDMIEEWIKKNPQASICTAEGISQFKEVANFQDYHGLPEFRKAVAKFMGLVRGGKVKFNPDRVVMSGGATGASETLMLCLADPGDAFLVPSPYYPAFARDLRWRTGVQLIPVNCSSSNNFHISTSDLEAAYNKAQAENINVKGLIITNPSNPLGTTLDKDILKSLLAFICQKNIHLVCDEIYSATVFAYPRFVSIAEVMEEMECNRDLIHIIYSLSKDMGFPGLRVGIIYSYNDAVVTCARRMSSFGLVSSQSQYLLASMLSDEAFIERFHEESTKRLGKRHDIFVNGLKEVGISCLNSNAGLYFWMDLRHLLEEQSFEAEMELWRAIINDVKLNVSPGSSFKCVEPGFFRVCFANMDDHTVVVALRRIQEFAAQGKKDDQEGKSNKRIWKRNLGITLSSRKYDETILSSPNSPICQSPLVRART